VTRPAQILLVDDEVSIQRAMAPLLRSRGYGVTLAGTGHEAVEMFSRERPDLVILDLGLPDMNGIDVCRQIRERADTPHPDSVSPRRREGQGDRARSGSGRLCDETLRPRGADGASSRGAPALSWS
jgi:CheY-like chemotaxis protein